MADDTNFVPRAELDGKFMSIDEKFASIITRLTSVEKKADTMATAQQALQDTITANTVKLDDIYGFLKHANTWVGFMKKHGPKVGYLLLGIAVSRGWITADNGKNIVHIFAG